MDSAEAPPTALPTEKPILGPKLSPAHQKDAYFTGYLANALSSLHRSVLGARSAHTWAHESRLASSLLYLSLTTLLGNRTLGEEYTDVVQIHAPSSTLPAVSRRAAYILASVLAPYAAAKVLPRHAHIRHLLAVFYFSGTYYELSKRLLGFRYIFTHKVPDTPDRAGYEVLGALLVVQLATQTYLHIRDVLSSPAAAVADHHHSRGRLSDAYSTELDVSLSDNAYASNNQLLNGAGAASGNPAKLNVERSTHTPILPSARYDLSNDSVMGFIKGAQQRKCTLCLEELKDPSATQWKPWYNTSYHCELFKKRELRICFTT
ncbi:unnamed protein product [Parascedosporium putredinis]|uniref:RING-type E3 ubiquitin transferase n=1 Tax=Parascedosporium putredinis TaxID=1442378 RepID=A0A9P1H493_9PEZI|nr:unnamed protein product [Parascedosporium putredinis]CAI7998036.1 unnamed protein product [Parascedosporium putredinis]